MRRRARPPLLSAPPPSLTLQSLSDVFVCVCVCVCAYMRACVRACVRVCVLTVHERRGRRDVVLDVRCRCFLAQHRGVCLSICLSVCLSVYMCVRVRVRECECERVCMHACIDTSDLPTDLACFNELNSVVVFVPHIGPKNISTFADISY